MTSPVAAEPAPPRSVAREYLESIVVAVILALFVRTFAVQAFKIPSASMEDNLLIGDHLLVNKLVYSPSYGPLEESLLGKKRISRGHVVVFKFPGGPERDFIKRVIGLPGETVEVKDRQVFIDGRLLDESYTFFKGQGQNPEESEPDLFADNARFSWGPKQVPEGQLFVMGDNRYNSSDSRFWGFLPIDQVKGRALLIYWSYKSTKDEYQRTSFWDWLKDLGDLVWHFPQRTRWNRFFHLIR